MCDPITIAGIALTAGSAVANSVAAGQDARARDSVLLAERLRQKALDQESFAINDASQDRFVDFAPQQEAKAQQLGDYLGATVAPDANTAAGSIMPSSESGIVNQDRSRQLADAQGFVDQQAGALGNLRSFGDLLGEKSLMQARDAGLISQIGGFKRGSSNIVPFELDEAMKAGDGTRMLADILGGLGQITTGVGLSGNTPSFLSGMFAQPAAKAGAGAVVSSAAKVGMNPAIRGASLFAPTSMLGA